MSESGCEIAGDVGVIVQISLAVLVGFVLITEYTVEYIKSLCTSGYTHRSFRTFWFDSYKICAGALVSHIFNIAVSIAIDRLSKNADQCAIYALAFFYEACGVPFVQLLQYGVIQYALKMSSQKTINDNNNNNNNSNKQSIMDDNCRQRWQWISKPGIYDANRYPVDDCLHCRSCQDSDARCNYIKIGIVIILAITISSISAYFGYSVYGTEWYVDVSMGFLVLIFLLSTAIAPISSLWQTTQWVIVKLFEKSIWSGFAMAQAHIFAKWSKIMSTNNNILDAWLYIAIVPIIMNAFMFFMFSRISRLKLPCFPPKYSERIEKEREIIESSLQNNGHNENLLLNNVNNVNDANASFIDLKFDKREAFKLGVVFMLMINMTLLIIATTYLGFKGALESIWILFISMIIAPTICSILGIYLFAYITNNNIHLCSCCVDQRNSRKNTTNTFHNIHGSINNGNGVFMNLDDLSGINQRKL
eukprot:60714_1